jgi:hypothetical protein
MGEERPDRGPELTGPELRPQAAGPQTAPASSTAATPRPASGYGAFHQTEPCYVPPPSHDAPEPARKPGWGWVALGVVAAAALTAGAWYALAPVNPPGPVPVAAAVQREKVFSVSKVDADLKATEYLKGLLGGKPSEAMGADPLRAVNAAALKALATTSPKTAEDIRSSRSVLYRVYLLDFLEEDGDHVELFVDGVSQGDVYLKNAGKEILIPLRAGVPAEMKLVATADGGGGVTVGFVSSLGEARTRVMEVGQSEQWQVTVQ